MNYKISSEGNILTGRNLLIFFVVVKLIITLFPFNYGIGGDEVYYLAMSDRLDIGYLDVPPLAPFSLAVMRFLFGTSFLSIHLLPAILGALVIVLTYFMIKKMGGSVASQAVGLTCVALAPQYSDFNFAYDTFDKLCWVALLYTTVLLLLTDDKKYWLYFGIVAGVGLLCKISILWLGFGIITAMAVTKERKHFLSWQLWAGGAIALLIFSPYIIWQIIHGFPSLEFYQNYGGKVTQFSALGFIMNNTYTMNPLSCPVWLSGLYYFLLNKEGRRYKIFGIAFLVILVLCIVQNAKPYLMAPIFVILFVGGAVFVETIFVDRKWILWTYSIIVFISGLAALPLERPLLPPETYIRIFGGNPGKNIERSKLGQLPQNFATRFGWVELTEKVAKVYNTLSEEEKKKTCIFTGNYSEAGAIHFYGRQYHLPEPISGHNQYYIWGPGSNTGEVAIVMGIPLDYLKTIFSEITEVERTDTPYAMPHENNMPIYLCRKPAQPFDKMKSWFKWLI